MVSISIYLDTRRAKNDGTYPLKINVRNKGQFLLSTGYSVMKERWGSNGYTNKEPNYRTKNAGLRKTLSDMENAVFRLEQDGKMKEMTDKALKEILAKCLPGHTTGKTKLFIDHMADFMNLKENPGTRAVYMGTINKLSLYDPDCVFGSMDADWLRRFERHMADSGMKVNARGIHLRNVRSVFNYAIDQEYTSLYPFRRFSIKKEETRKRCLTAVQMATLRDYPCKEYQSRCRDLFMLMFYLIGINASDLFLARKEDVVNGRLEYKRHKTGKLYSIKIEPEAQALIDKHTGKGGYLLDVMDDYGYYKDFLNRMGVALKQIGEAERLGLGGKKERSPLFPALSPYWSRHTWATIAAELEVPMETISKALGHEIGSKVTSIYIRFDERKIDEANRKVIDYLNSIKAE